MDAACGGSTGLVSTAERPNPAQTGPLPIGDHVRICSLDDRCNHVSKLLETKRAIEVAKKAAKKKAIRKEYTASDVKLLKMHSKAKTPAAKLSKTMKRSEGSLRQKALKLGMGLGHQR
jgi:hypothetical protein